MAKSPTKVCSLCRKKKPLSAFYDARQSRCRACDKASYHDRADQSRRWIDDYARTWRKSFGLLLERAAAFVDAPDGVDGCGVDGRGGPPLRYFRLQHQAIVAYGGYRCACCGETEPLLLTLDHINNDGARHRRQLGGSMPLYQWLRDNNYPPGFQVLCASCNLGRHRNGGVCPHQKRRAREED